MSIRVIRLLPKASYKTMPWKNGRGVTREIAVDPLGFWRLSSASVKELAPFSEFKGFDRLLTPISGHGIFLNDLLLRPFEVHQFSGESIVSGKSVDGEEVFDLGLIFQREKIRASMSSIEVDGKQAINLASGHHFIFSARGDFTLDSVADRKYEASAGDSIEITVFQPVQLIFSASFSTLIHTYIQEV